MQYNVINWKRAASRTSDIVEFFTLTCTPLEEPCTPAGGNEDHQITECTALINQLIRKHGQPPANTEFFIVENTGHDAGIYYEAGIFYKPEQISADGEETDNSSEEYACNIEGGGIPDNWDREAINELRAAEHPNYQPAKVVRMKAA